MGAFKDLRDQLAADLAVIGVPVHASLPDDLDVPCVFLVPPLTASYITAANLYGASYVLALDVVVLVAHTGAGEAYEAVESLVEAVLANTVDWTLTGVDPPAALTVTEGGAEYMGTLVHLSKPTHL